LMLETFFVILYDNITLCKRSNNPMRNTPQLQPGQNKTKLANSDEKVDMWLQAARRGDKAQLDQLYEWAYQTAQAYYRHKVISEINLTNEDAEELTSTFFLEFERSLAKIKSAPRYTRHVVKKNLGRFLKRKRKLQFRNSLVSNQDLEMQPIAAEELHRWSDEDFMQYRAVLQCLKEVDEVTRKIIELRIEEPQQKFHEIARAMRMSETSVRMRATRFYGQVRKKYQKIRYNK